MLDGLSREIQATREELKAALLKSTTQAAETAQKTEENNEQLKTLNDQLEKLVGKSLNVELEKLNKLLSKVTDTYVEQEKLMKKAADYGKSVKSTSKETKDLTQEIEKLDIAAKGSGDTVAKFGEKLGSFGSRAIDAAEKVIGGLADAYTKSNRQYFVDALRSARDVLFKRNEKVDAAAASTKATEEVKTKESPLFSIEKELKELPEVNDLQDLCKCICNCLGVNFKEVKKNETANTNTLIKKQSKWENFKGFFSKIGENIGRFTLDPLKNIFKKKTEEEKKTAKEASFEKWAMRAYKGANAGRAVGGALTRIVYDEKPVEKFLTMFSQGLAKASGGVFAFTGDLLELIPFVGGGLKSIMHALGGFSEGLINFVLQPLAEQVSIMSESLRSMFISTGAGFGTPVIEMPGGREFGETAKRSAEFATNMDNASRSLQMFGADAKDVDATFQSWGTVTQTLFKNFRRGIRDAKDLRAITRTSLATATMLGANADHTADLFADWHQKLGMSNKDLGIMQMQLVNIARNTGLFGDELVQVAKQSEQFLHNMRLAGTLTTTASRQVIELTARGKQTGTEAGTARLLETLTKTGLNRGGPQGMALASIGGGANFQLQQKALLGTLVNSEEDLREFGENLDKFGSGLLRAYIKLKPGEKFAEALERLNPNQLSLLSEVLQQYFGVSAKEFAILIDNVRKTSMSFDERLKEIKSSTRNEAAIRAMSTADLKKLFDTDKDLQERFNDELKKAGGDAGKAVDAMLKLAKLPTAIREQLEGQATFQQAKFREQELLLTTGATIMDDFNKIIAKEGSDFKSAFAEISQKKNYQQYFTAIGANLEDGGKAIEKSLMDQAKILQERATALEIPFEEIKPEDIAKAIAKAQGGDKKSLSLLANRIDGLRSAIALQAQAKADPVLDLTKEMRKIQADILSGLQQTLFVFVPLLTSFLKDLRSQPFWKAFNEGDITKGFELLGTYIKNIPTSIAKVFEDFKNLPPEVKKPIIDFAVGVAKGFFEAVGWTFETLGTALEQDSGKLGEFFNTLKKTLSETDWSKVGETIGKIAGVFETINVAGIIGAILAVEKFFANFLSILDAIKSKWKDITDLVEYVSVTLNPFLKSFNRIMTAVWKDLQNNMEIISKALAPISASITETWEKIGFGKLTKKFEGFVEGLWDTLKVQFIRGFAMLSLAFIGMIDTIISLMQKIKIGGLKIPGIDALREEFDNFGKTIKEASDAQEALERKRIASRTISEEGVSKFFTEEEAKKRLYGKGDLGGAGDREQREKILTAQLADPAKLRELVAKSPLAQRALETKDEKLTQEMIDQLEASTKWDKSNNEYLNNLQQIVILRKLAERGFNPGSIYVHDTHAQAKIEDMSDMLQAYMDNLEEAQALVRPIMPSSTIEEEMKRKNAELQGMNEGELGEVENNTRDTAISTRQMVGLLRRIAASLSNRGGNSLMDVPETLEDFVGEEVPAFDTGWKHGQQGRVVGLEYT